MLIQKFNARVVEKKYLTEDVFRLSITTPDNFSFKRGQFMTFVLDKDGKKISRSYSILSPRQENGKISFIIKIIKGGLASGLFKKIKIGETFEVKGPFGHFIYTPGNNTEEWFIASGTGLAPLYSMIKANLEEFSENKSFPEKKIVLLLSAKHKRDMIMHKELLKLEKENKNFGYMVSLTREDWKGRKGRVQKHLPEDCSGKTFYICGIKEMVIEVKEKLLERGVKPEDIKFERYS